MEEDAKWLLDACKIGAYHTETKEELEAILRANGGTKFIVWGNTMFTVNEYDIIEGIGFSLHNGVHQGFKIWNNKYFGTFDK